MRMPDGGWRPAYNAQLTADDETGASSGWISTRPATMAG